MNRQPTVFIVDDDDAIRKGLTLSLKERRYRVQGFESANAFLDAIEPDMPGCLILDVRMPHISGLELQDVLRERAIALPIIFVTAYGDVPTTVRAMRKGAIDFLEKPYELDVLLERIEEALSRDARHREHEVNQRAVGERFARSSPRERDVMRRIVADAATTPNRVVAEELGISQRTVETYRTRLMEKMQARSLTELVAMAQICDMRSS